MKRASLKQRLSSLLAATMVFSIVAPATPTWAASKTLTLDIASNNPGVFISTENIASNNPGVLTLTENIRFTGENGGEINLDGYTDESGRKLLPFLPTGYSVLSPEVNVNPGTGTAYESLATKIKEDYKIEGWYDANNSSQKRKYIPTTYPYQDTTMYLRLKPNGNKYIVEYNYNATGVYLGNEKQEKILTEVLVPINKSPKTIDGFKLEENHEVTTRFYKVNSNSKGNGRTVDNFDSRNATAISDQEANVIPKIPNGESNSALIPNFSYHNQQVKGYGIPYDVKVDFNYVADQSKKNSLIVRDVFQKTDGSPISERIRNGVGGEYYATQDITDITPDSTLITPQGTEQQGTEQKARYILESVSLVKPGTTTPLPSVGSNPSNEEIGKISISNENLKLEDKVVKGKMVNYPVEVRYIYRVNPDYNKNIRIRYVDNLQNDITDKVVEKLQAQGSGYTLGNTAGNTDENGGGIYKDGVSINYKIDRIGNYRIPAPKIEGYMGAAPTMLNKSTNPARDGFGIGNESWQATNREYFSVSTGNLVPLEDFSITVQYTVDPNNVKNVNLSWNTGGKIMVPDRNGVEYSIGTTGHVKQVTKDVSSDSYKVTTNEVYEAVAEPGYQFIGYQYKKTAATGETWVDYTLGENIPSVDIQGSEIMIKAVFAPRPEVMNHYFFTSNDPNLDYSNLNTAKIENIPTVDANGQAREVYITDSKIEALANISSVRANPGYEVAWFVENTGVEITSTTDISHMSGTKFVARAIPTNVGSNVVEANAEGVLNPAGTPLIQVQNENPMINARLHYVVVDDAGNVVANIPGSQLVDADGKIMGDFLTPSYPYKVYTIDPRTPAGGSVAVGSPLPDTLTLGTDLSNPVDIVIPATASLPAVGYDPNDPTRYMITVAPTTGNTEYALYDPAGNMVKTWTAPSTPGGAVVFDDLDPATTYTVVPRKAGSTDAGYPENGTQVSTNSLTPLKVPHKIIYDSPQKPTSVKLDGVEQDVNNLADILASVEPDVEVEITADAIDLSTAPFYPFSGFSYPSSIQNTSTNPMILNFKMPNHEVQIVARYLAAGVIIDAATPSNAVPAPSIPSGVIFEGTGNSGATFPSLPSDIPQGRYRLYMTQKSPTQAQEQAGGMDESHGYHGLFVVQAQMQVWDEMTMEWRPYTGDVGPISMKLDTGATDKVKAYSLKELDGVGGSSELSLQDVDFHSIHTIYPGFFTVDTIENGKEYIFGYTVPPSYRIRLRSNRVSSFRKTLVVLEGNALMDHALIYQTEIGMENALPNPDTQGITWTYQGLSTSDSEYIPYDENLMITEDETVYIYFQNDRLEREKAFYNLVEQIIDANILTVDVRISDIDKAELESAIAAAEAVKNQASPRRSSTAELKAAFDRLRALYYRIYDSFPSGGSRSGGGSGGGGTRKVASTNTKAKSGYVVGADGDWQLLDANTHQWVFNLKSGNRTKGWNLLSYNYNGQLRSDWYYFADNHIMRDGWFLDTDTQTWYFLSEHHDGFFGHMRKGWHYDTQDGKWYYLDKENGAMHTGWRKIDGIWYYLNPTAPAQTWSWDESTGKWIYDNTQNTRPLGAMYSNEITPDGYQVDINGAWIP